MDFAEEEDGVVVAVVRRSEIRYHHPTMTRQEGIHYRHRFDRTCRKRLTVARCRYIRRHHLLEEDRRLEAVDHHHRTTFAIETVSTAVNRRIRVGIRYSPTTPRCHLHEAMPDHHHLADHHLEVVGRRHQTTFVIEIMATIAEVSHQIRVGIHCSPTTPRCRLHGVVSAMLVLVRPTTIDAHSPEADLEVGEVHPTVVVDSSPLQCDLVLRDLVLHRHIISIDSEPCQIIVEGDRCRQMGDQV